MRKTNRRSVRQLRAAMVLTLLICQPALADPDPLFQSDDVLEMTLTGELRALARDSSDVPELRPATLSFAGPDGPVTLAVNLEPRGKSRRDRDVCTFPPLWVHFDKSAVEGTLFEKQKRLKMVTYCRSPSSFQDYVLKEYLAYRIFNQLTDASFRVRLLRVHFAEMGDGRDPLVRYAFFIEHKRRLAKRLDADVVEPEERIPSGSLEPEQATIAEVFQFMVSNTDFSFIAPPVDDTCCHNAILLAAEGADGNGDDEGPYLPVPYDFDRTGFVDPPNGEPAAELGQRSFRDRVYRGFCRDPGYLDAALARTEAARPAIENLVRTQADLGARSRDRALSYLAGYYDVIADPKRREQALKCRRTQ
ncbi:MAG: hypothetical protein AB7I04_17775 [Pseudomonadales bacterium]